MRRIIVLPAVFIGCMIVIWVGTVAAANMPSEKFMAYTATAYASSNQTATATVLGEKNTTQETQADDVQTCSLPTSYPDEVLQWCGPIEDSADETGLPPALIAAVILQESGGDPLAYSSSGAVGLMQVMPRNGIAAEFMCVNGPCFAARPTIDELQNPAFNITFGSQMLAGLYTKYGSYREALFHYGPANIGYHYADLVIRIWESYL